MSENLAGDAIQASEPDEALHERRLSDRTVGEFVIKVYREVFVVKWQRQLGVDVHVVDSEWPSQLDS